MRVGVARPAGVSLPDLNDADDGSFPIPNLIRGYKMRAKTKDAQKALTMPGADSGNLPDDHLSTMRDSSATVVSSMTACEPIRLTRLEKVT